jgi:hypothetical protein
VGKQSRMKRQRRQSLADVDELADDAITWCGGREHTPAGLVFALRGAQWITSVTGRRSWETRVDIFDLVVLGLLAHAHARLTAMSRFEYLAARNAIIDQLDGSQRQALFAALASASVEAAKASDTVMGNPQAWVPTLHTADSTAPADNGSLLALPETLAAEILHPSRPGNPPRWTPAPDEQVTALKDEAAAAFTPDPNDPLAPTPREAITRGLHELAGHPDVGDRGNTFGGPGEVLSALAVGYDVNDLVLAAQLRPTQMWVAFPTASSAHQLLAYIAGMPASARALTRDETLGLVLGHPAIDQPTRLDSPTSRVQVGENLLLLGAKLGLTVNATPAT